MHSFKNISAFIPRIPAVSASLTVSPFKLQRNMSRVVLGSATTTGTLRYVDRNMPLSKIINRNETYSRERMQPFKRIVPLMIFTRQYIKFSLSFFRNSIAKNSLMHFSLPSVSKFMFAWKPDTSTSMFGPTNIILMLLNWAELFLPMSTITHGFVCC